MEVQPLLFSAMVAIALYIKHIKIWVEKAILCKFLS